MIKYLVRLDNRLEAYEIEIMVFIDIEDLFT